MGKVEEETGRPGTLSEFSAMVQDNDIRAALKDYTVDGLMGHLLDAEVDQFKYHRYGRALYAIGGNEEAARAAGINVDKVIWSAFIFAALLAGLAGVLMTGRLDSALVLTPLDRRLAMVVSTAATMMTAPAAESVLKAFLLSASTISAPSTRYWKAYNHQPITAGFSVHLLHTHDNLIQTRGFFICIRVGHFR